MADSSSLKPYHESVVDVINQAQVHELDILASLLKATKLPKGHEEVAEAWNRRLADLGGNDEAGVTEAVLAQKPVEQPAVS